MSQDISIALLQEDVGFKLNSAGYFSNINVQLERKELYASEVELAAVWQTIKGGASGIGVIVAMPDLNIPDADSPGPELVCEQMFTVLEEPNVNQKAGTGTQIFAEDVGIYLLQLLHQFSLAQNITLYGKGMAPNREYAGIRGVDCKFGFRFTPAQLNACATVPISFADGECTLTCATAGATIYYTTDGSFPGQANGAAQVYAGPFAVAPGTQVRAAGSYPAAGLVDSNVWTETA